MSKPDSLSYHPAHLLASLGAGGLAVSFYLYLLFLTPHPGIPVPTIDSLNAAQAAGQIGLWWRLPWALALIFVAVHFMLLLWNMPRYQQYKRKHSEQLMLGDAAFIRFAWPLLLAMSMNAGFVMALLTIPGLWNVIEYIFPIAITLFIGIGLFELAQLAKLLAGSLQGKKALLAGNNLAALMPAFAFGMIAVGLAGPAAMSHHIGTSATALFFVVLFTMAAVLIVFSFGPLALGNILRNGITRDDSNGLMILVPIATILGIAAYRVLMSLLHHFEIAVPGPVQYLAFAGILSFQLLILALGITVMKSTGAWRALWSDSPSPTSFAVICPGVAFVVSLDFFLARGITAISDSPVVLNIGWGLSIGLQSLVIVLFVRLLWKSRLTAIATG